MGQRAYYAHFHESQTARYAMKREVAAAWQAGFSVEYVRFQTGRKQIPRAGRRQGYYALQSCKVCPFAPVRRCDRSGTCQPSSFGFISTGKETPGGDVRSGAARQLKL